MPTPSAKYHVTYHVRHNPEGLTASEVKAMPHSDELGACHSFIGFSLLYPLDGTFSMLMMSLDGSNGEALSDVEVFKVWTLMSSRLAESKTLSEPKKAFCRATFDAFRNMLLNKEKK